MKRVTESVEVEAQAPMILERLLTIERSHKNVNSKSRAEFSPARNPVFNQVLRGSMSCTALPRMQLRMAVIPAKDQAYLASRLCNASRFDQIIAFLRIVLNFQLIIGADRAFRDQQKRQSLIRGYNPERTGIPKHRIIEEGMHMNRMFLGVIGVAVLTVSLAGCSGDWSPAEQDAAFREYRCTLQPGKKC